jgi:PAS domain S-box-containing protein
VQGPHAFFSRLQSHWISVCSLLIFLTALGLFATTLGTSFYRGSLAVVLLSLVLVALCVAIALHVQSLLIKRREQRQMASALNATQRDFEQMADNIHEIFWMLDAESLNVIYVNQAYEAITGRPCQSLKDNPKSYEDVIHPEDRVRVLSRLNELVETGQFNEEFRIRRADGIVRWVFGRGFPVRDAAGSIRRLVGTAQDISSRRSAEERMARSLELAESARAEAEAFRKTSFALTQDLSMNHVLDTLLQSLSKLVSCESLQVFLIETDTHTFLARELQDRAGSAFESPTPAALDARDNRFLMEVLASRESLLILDTASETQWTQLEGFSHLRSWLCVPLIASEQVLGFLSLGDTRAHAFSQEHLRLAKSLAIPAAVAIQNARLYERAEIYGIELQQRLADLEVTQQALRLAEEGRTLSEERFTKVFRSSPTPFSITTLEEGRFVDINNAFEKQYGYTRSHLIGRTILEVGLWEDPNELRRIGDEIREHGSVRGLTTRLRKSSGEALDTIVSAESGELDGRKCLFAVCVPPMGRNV